MNKLLLVLFITSNLLAKHNHDLITSKVVHLYGDRFTCTGIHVKAPSNISYILTAAHCAGSTNELDVEMNDKRAIPRKILEIPLNPDIMIMEGLPGVEGIDIAKESPKKENTYYGYGFPFNIYTVNKLEYIEDRMINLNLFDVDNLKDMKKCLKDPNNIIKGKNCIKQSLQSDFSNSLGAGSSGGPVVNSNNELIGIISTGAIPKSYVSAVTLSDIIILLESY